MKLGRSVRPALCAAVLAGHAFVLSARQPAIAAFEGPVEVAQPLVTEEGISVSTVTFMRYTDRVVAGYAVSLVGEESCVMQEGHGPGNRNAASLLGIVTGYVQNQTDGGLFGDTLKVFMELSGLRTDADLKGWSLQAAVKATLESVLITASWERRGYDWQNDSLVYARYVQVQVRGSTAFSHLGGTFDFTSLAARPRGRRF